MRTQVYADEYRSPAGLTTWMVVSSVLTYVLLAAVLAVDAYGRSTFSTWDDDSMEFVSDAEATVGLLLGVSALGFLAALVVSAVTYFRWLYRMIKNSRALGVRGVQATPHGAWLWHLVPFANLVMPFRVMKQIGLSVEPGVGDIDHLSDRTPADVTSWWAFFLLGGIAGRVADGMMTTNVTMGTWLSAVSFGLGVVALVYLIRIARRFAWMMDEKASEVFAAMEEHASIEASHYSKYRGL
ncbi:DUF4328 domain-containing protein [Mucisphaera calidilacus]|uniref:DUF4328 domain-containing protein n=1 Tax=Mucisphaera calidilacus TaxID=2527982 RepID=A0A518BY71_9BACT|nr:DUF4328 domain-containing protein [Mucisphaera calidilacus]QDU71921.1 hypothetical protein Pan265_17800 [Mucisphaera calidilacus]